MSVDRPRRVVCLDDVRRRRDEILAIAESYGVRNIRVFGSVARGEAVADSDLDLLIDVDPGHGYFDMAGFALQVEDFLGSSLRSPRWAASRPGSGTGFWARPLRCEERP